MKRLFILASHFLIFLPSLFAHDIPNDNILLRTIYGNVNRDGESVTKNLDDYGSLTFKISFKGYVRTESQNILLVVCRASVFYQFGHKFGFTHYYYLNHFQNQLKVIQSFDESDISPIGDSNQMELMELGKNKYALAITFQSTGNRHYERNIELMLIGKEQVKSIGSIGLDYSNEGWVENEDKSPRQECVLNSYVGSTEIYKNGKDWFAIKVTRKTKIFNEECMEVAEKTRLFVYQNKGEGYEQIK